MNQETLIAVKIALEKKSIYSLFSDVIGIPEEIENENSDRYALMFNVENNELFFLPMPHMIIIGRKLLSSKIRGLK